MNITFSCNLFQGVFIFQMANFTRASYEEYLFPLWADSLGWLMGISTMAPFFIFAVYVLYKGEYVTYKTSLFLFKYTLISIVFYFYRKEKNGFSQPLNGNHIKVKQIVN